MTKYPVNDIYYSIQGEGMLAGTPMVILRLHGCPVECPFCDTKETWEHGNQFEQTPETITFGKHPQWVNLESMDIAKRVSQMFDYQTDTEKRFPSMAKWVLLTGGEPCIHDLYDLVFDLHTMGFKVALETSGTFAIKLTTALSFDWICVSPKLVNPDLPLQFDVIRRAHEIKMVIGSMKHIHQLHTILEQSEPLGKETVISLQPMSQSKIATELCIKMAKHYNWNLSIQIHQYLEIE